jgi:phosphoribosylanthranilate isomerase
MWIKICGITNLADAEHCVAAGADAIGFNFYADSKRCVDVEMAREIISRLPSSVLPVGVFVNHSCQEICSICERTGISTVQLHGDEPPELAASLSGVSVMRVFRIGSKGLAPVEQELQSYRDLGISLRACLVDAHVAGQYGGSGQTAPWDVLAAGWQQNWPPLILAGGLTPGNVSEAIAAVRPIGVDVASGVEISPRRKDPNLVARFITGARAAARSARSTMPE